MSLTIKVELKNDLAPVIKEALQQFSPQSRAEFNKLAGRESLKALKRYHHQFNVSGKWSKRGGRASAFGNEVTRGWGMARADAQGVTLTNAAPHFAFKITGGIIRPKRVKALTVPLIPEAKGRFAETFERATGKRLFRPFGTNILAYKTSDSKGFRAVYALVKQVIHKPTPGAMPREQVYAGPFVQMIESKIKEALG